MVQFSYLKQIARRVRPGNDRPTGEPFMLTPPRLLFRQGEVNQPMAWGDETSLSYESAESRSPQSSESAQSRIWKTSPFPEISTSPSTENRIQPPASNPSSLQSKTSQPEALQSAPSLQELSQQTETGTVNQFGSESLAIARPTSDEQLETAQRILIPPTLSSTPSLHETVEPFEATASEPHPPSRPKQQPSSTDRLTPPVQSSFPVTSEASHRAVQALQTVLEPGRPIQPTHIDKMTEPPSQRLMPMGGSEPSQRSTVHIGAIEVHIVPPPVPPPPISPKVAPVATKSGSASTLSRGFISAFGLRQG